METNPRKHERTVSLENRTLVSKKLKPFDPLRAEVQKWQEASSASSSTAEASTSRHEEWFQSHGISSPDKLSPEWSQILQETPEAAAMQVEEIARLNQQTQRQQETPHLHLGSPNDIPISVFRDVHNQASEMLKRDPSLDRDQVINNIVYSLSLTDQQLFHLEAERIYGHTGPYSDSEQASLAISASHLDITPARVESTISIQENHQTHGTEADHYPFSGNQTSHRHIQEEMPETSESEDYDDWLEKYHKEQSGASRSSATEASTQHHPLFERDPQLRHQKRVEPTDLEETPGILLTHFRNHIPTEQFGSIFQPNDMNQKLEQALMGRAERQRLEQRPQEVPQEADIHVENDPPEVPNPQDKGEDRAEPSPSQDATDKRKKSEFLGKIDKAFVNKILQAIRGNAYDIKNPQLVRGYLTVNKLYHRIRYQHDSFKNNRAQSEARNRISGFPHPYNILPNEDSTINDILELRTVLNNLKSIQAFKEASKFGECCKSLNEWYQEAGLSEPE